MLEINKIHHGDCLELIKQLPHNSIDAVITDPPYGLSFMGKKWDYDVPNVEVWKECLRVLKPGGHLLSFAGTRTQHRMACNIEDAGFEIRDMIMWCYGSGFPKSLNIGKQIDKLQGNNREIVGEKIRGDVEKAKQNGVTYASADANRNNKDIFGYGKEILTKGTSEWEGWGTALKPALEPITVARKPLSEKNVALNVLKWRTGGININGCRIRTDELTGRNNKVGSNIYGGGKGFPPVKVEGNNIGRFPANIILDEEAGKMLDEQSGESNSIKSQRGEVKDNNIYQGFNLKSTERGHNDSGGASRFFYCAKASKSERNNGLEDSDIKKSIGHNRFDKCINCGGYLLQNQERPSACKCKNPKREDNIIKGNHHPTVKPIKLMGYLVNLITPSEGIVLDPFIGSGTTAIACKQLNCNFIGIEKEENYVDIANQRLSQKTLMEDNNVN